LIALSYSDSSLCTATMYLKTVLMLSVFVFAQAQKCAHLDLLFLVDESQSMLVHNGFENGKNFVVNVVKAFSALPDTRYAWVTFNSKVWEQTPFQSAEEFSSHVQSTQFNTGASDYYLGFNAAKQSISQSSKSDRETVIIFFSDAHPTHGPTEQVAELTKQIRCDLKTKIIGLGIGEDASAAELMRQMIGAGVSDSCMKATYEDVPNFGSVASEGVSIVQRLIGCQSF